MHIEILLSGDNFAYLVRYGNTAFVVDPGEAAPVAAWAVREKCAISHVLLTHHHADHCGGVIGLCAEFGCTVMAANDRRMPRIDCAVSDGDEFLAAGLRVRVIGVPGHTRDHLAFLLSSELVVFTGDTLFVAGCGRLLEDSAEVMWQSLLKLRALPDETQVYCGHDYALEDLEFAGHLESANRDVADRLRDVRAMVRAGRLTVPSTIGEEKRTNPFLRADTPELAQAVHHPHANPVAVFAELRQRKDRW